MNILIVDDEPFVLSSLKRNIGIFDSSVSVDTSISVKEALEKVTLKKYDCILSDLNMPDQDGYIFIKQLKKNRITTPLIIMTGCPKTESAVECMKCGAVDFITKPFSAETFIEKVKNIQDTPKSWGDGYRIKNYILTDIISETASSLVFKARKKDSDTFYAVKTLKNEDIARKKTTYLRFKREIETLQKVHHPNIIKIEDFGVSKLEIPYMVMPFISGVPLDEKIDELTQDEFIQIIIKICNSLEYLHNQNLVHRDIKPGNILIMPDNEPVLIDFGIILVKDDTQLTKDGVIIGTPNYMAPEAFSNSHILKPQADIYSIGTLIYRYVYKKCPFQGDGVYDIIKNLINLDEKELFTGSIFDSLLKKLLKKNAQERPSSVLCIIEELKKISASG